MTADFKIVLILSLVAFVCAMAEEPGIREGLVNFIGAQNKIFQTGKADGALPLGSLRDGKGLYAVGPAKGLDGEITVWNSRPYITKVRGAGYTVEQSWDYDAIFLVWTHQEKWQEVAIPANITGYLDLQKFVNAQAASRGIDTAKPFPFLLSGTPAEVKWHINVDRSEGKSITPERFAQSKAGYMMKGEPVDVIGFYSERHPGIFITPYTPAIQPGSGNTNALHMHLVSRKSEAAGHIDDITLAGGMVLRLPVVP
jgi:acetolactate decarboxylase